MIRYIKRFVAGVLMGLMSLFVLGFGLCVMTEAVEEYVFPWVMSFPPSQVTVLDNPAAVDPALEGSLVRAKELPVRVSRIPEALLPYRQATETPSFHLPEHGVLSPVYYGVQSGARISYIGRQMNGALLVDSEVNNLVYWRQWWQMDAETARRGLWKAAFLLAGAYAILFAAVWMGNSGVQVAFGGFRLFCVSAVWPALALLVGAFCLILLGELRSRTLVYETEPWEYGVGIALLCVLAVLGLVRRKSAAS